MGITYPYPLYRAYIGISHRGALVGVHPTIPLDDVPDFANTLPETNVCRPLNIGRDP